MDMSNLRKLVGRDHEEEVRAIIEQDGYVVENIHLKSPTLSLILSIFLGILAIDRLYTSGFKIFLCKIAMLVFTLGTWWIVDIGYSMKLTREANYNKIIKRQVI